MYLEIPWPDGPAWRQSIAIDGRIYAINGRWNEIGEFWALDIGLIDGTPIVNGIKVTSGVLLTARHASELLPRGFFVLVSSLDCGCTPGRDDMEKNARLIYVQAV